MGAAAIAALTLFAILFLWVESETAVAGLLLAAVATAVAGARLGWLAQVQAALGRHDMLLNGGAVVAVLAIAAFFYRDHFALLMVATVLLYVLACLGLTIQFGYAGILNFSGAAFFGVGAYTAAVLTAHTPVPHLLVLLAGGAMAALIGSILIYPVLRTRGHYAAVVTIAFALLFKTFLEVNDVLGGPQGLAVANMNLFGWDFGRGVELGPLEASFILNYVLLALLLVVIGMLLVKRLERSWIGLDMDAIRLDETASACFGIDLARWKITAFTLGNFLTGVAGALYGMMLAFIAPNNFTFADGLIMVSIVLLGGIGNPWGVVVAAVIVIILPEKLQVIQEYRFLLFAATVILILRFRPGGLLPAEPAPVLPGLATVSAPLLCDHRPDPAVRRSGGARRLRPRGRTRRDPRPDRAQRLGQDHVLQRRDRDLSGKRRPGRSRRRGHHARSPQQVYRAGIARTFQRSRLCLPLSIFDNIMVGNHARLDHGLVFNLFRRRAFRAQLEANYAAARELVVLFDPPLADRLFEAVGGIPMIDRRRIEICRALISRPKLLLLDEPSAGMTHEETRQLMDDILTVRARMEDLTIVIIEHEMNVIERITERCVVLNYGRKIAEGSYREVAAERQVQEAYLGLE